MHVEFARIAAILTALCCTCAGAQAQTNATAGASQAGSPATRVSPWRKRPGLRPSRLRSGASTAPTYTLVSLGEPTAYSEPAAFNNTGQVVGYGSTGCYVYDAGSFSRLPIPSANAQYVDCRIGSISDKAADGTYQIGGTTGNPYVAARYAFAVTPRTPIIYYAYESSTVLGINNNGVSLFSAAFEPVRTTDFTGQQLFTAANGGGYLTQLQAPASSEPAIHYLLPLSSYAYPTCTFGGCEINDRNEILGYDYFTLTDTSANLAVYTLGNPASLVDLPIDAEFINGFLQSSPPAAFNDRNQILYDGPAGPTIYEIGSGKKTVIPLVTPSCPKGGSGSALSMNNSGEALGQYQCGSFAGYFTWDAATGTHDLSLTIPNTNFLLFPLGVNDNGQILVVLTVGFYNTPVGWGTLDPIASSSAKARTGSLRTQ